MVVALAHGGSATNERLSLLVFNRHAGRRYNVAIFLYLQLCIKFISVVSFKFSLTLHCHHCFVFTEGEGGL